MRENKSVLRILAILELISRHPEGLTLGQIYRKLEMPKATAHDFLQTLYKADAIYYKDPRVKNYVIGSKIFAIGSVYTKNSSLIDASSFELIEYANKHKRTVFLTKRIGQKVVYVFKYQAEGSKIMTPEEIGSTLYDFDSNSIGIGYSVFDEKVMNKEIPNFDKISKQGYYLGKDPHNSHICSLVVPVLNFENRVVGLMVAAELSIDECDLGESRYEFIEIAKHVSRKLGYIGNFNA